MLTDMLTEILTDEMVHRLRREAAAAGDEGTVADCENAVWADAPSDRAAGRARVALVINDARGMDDETPFVRVTP